MAIVKKNDYDSTSAFGQSDFKTLPKGGYIVRIIKAEETADKHGNPMVHIAFDICDGEFSGYFMNLFQSRKKNSDHPMDVKYPFEGQMWIGVNDYEDPNKTSRKFKGFCTALEDSGADVWSPKGEFQLLNVINAEVGVVYQSVEQEYNGKTSWRAIPWGFRSVQSIESGDFFVPDDKPLPQKSNYGGFNPMPTTGNSYVDSFSAANDDIPFK